MTPHALFPMPPEVTQVILGGGSPIDLDSLRIHSPGEARNFALNYGYDMDVSVQRAAVMRVYEDAVDFLEAVVLEGTSLHVPLEVRDLQDPLAPGRQPLRPVPGLRGGPVVPEGGLRGAPGGHGAQGEQGPRLHAPEDAPQARERRGDHL